jgi:hypothetical protein
MFKYTKHSLKKLETLFEELEYTVRYEKGSFQSGYCLVENKKVAVINKFFDTEGRINCLLEILANLEVDAGQLSAGSAKVYRQATRPGSEDGGEDEATNEAEDVGADEEDAGAMTETTGP